MGKFSLSLSSLCFFSPSLAVPWFGLLSHVSSLRLSSGHSSQVLTLSNASCASLFSPRLLVVDASLWATSPLGAVDRPVRNLWVLFIYLFFLLVMLPSSPVDHILSDLSTMTSPSWVAPRAWLSFIELDKAVVLV